MGDPATSLQPGSLENRPKFSLGALESPPLPASTPPPPSAKRQSNPHISQQASGFLRARLCPSPPTYVRGVASLGYTPPAGVGGARNPAFQMCLATPARKDTGGGTDRRKRINNFKNHSGPSGSAPGSLPQEDPRSSGWGRWEHYLAVFPPLEKSLPPRERHLRLPPPPS